MTNTFEPFGLMRMHIDIATLLKDVLSASPQRQHHREEYQRDERRPVRQAFFLH
jgi:hypothetical protein